MRAGGEARARLFGEHPRFGRVAPPLAVALILSGLAVLMTWPLLPNLDRAVTDPGDPYIVTFAIEWVASRLAQGSLDVFDAPILHPVRQSLAFTEHMIGLAVLALPLRAIGLQPLTIYNILLLAGFVASGLAAWLLAWHLSRSQMSAAAAAIFYAFVPYRMGHASHLQHVWSAVLPLALWTLFRLRERPTAGRAVSFGLSIVLLGLTNIHWLLFGSVALALSAIVLAFIGKERGRFTGASIAGFLLAALLLLPTLLPYRTVSREHGLSRTTAEVEAYSASAADWLVPAAYSRTYDAPRVDHEPERRLFPGVILLAGTMAGLIGARRTTAAARSAFLVLALWLVLGWIGSLGINGGLHRWLFEYAEPFRAIRVPARWAMISYTAMSVLAALATATWTSRCSRFVALAITVFYCTLFLYEVRTFPIRWYLRDSERADVYRWMRDLPTGVATLELPIQAMTSEYEYTLAAATHRRPIVNGASGFLPPFQRGVIEDAHANPIPDRLLERLDRANVRLIVVHADRLGEHEPSTVDFLRRNLDAGRIRTVGRFAHEQRGDYVFLIEPSFRERDPIDERLERDTTDGRRLFEDLASGRFVASARTGGVLDFPPPGYRAVGGLLVSGWASSPRGIREVRVRFNNGRVEIAAERVARPDLEAIYPGIPSTGFRLEFRERPPEIHSKADLQIRIIDRTGKSTDLPQVWFDWVRMGE